MAHAALAAMREGAKNNTNYDSNYNSNINNTNTNDNNNNNNDDNSNNNNDDNKNNSENSNTNNDDDDSRRGLQAACDLEEDSNAVCGALASTHFGEQHSKLAQKLG